jgi:hypothetical protein
MVTSIVERVSVQLREGCPAGHSDTQQGSCLILPRICQRRLEELNGIFPHLPPTVLGTASECGGTKFVIFHLSFVIAENDAQSMINDQWRMENGK